MRSLGGIMDGSNTDSRHAMASLFKLRRCDCEASFSRSYTESGMFFSIKVVGILLSIQCATIMLSWSRWNIKITG